MLQIKVEGNVLPEVQEGRLDQRHQGDLAHPERKGIRYYSIWQIS